MEKNIDTIFIDLGDTFRVIRKDREYQREAKAVITRCLGVDTDPEDFYRDVIEPRYDKYREWALTYYCEAPVEVLWTRWLAYDFPKDRVIAHAAEMTWAYRKTKGERVVTDGGIDTIKSCTAGVTPWQSSATWWVWKRWMTGWITTACGPISSPCSSPPYASSVSPIPPSIITRWPRPAPIRSVPAMWATT